MTVDANGWNCTMTPIFEGHASLSFQQASRAAHRSMPTHVDRTIVYLNGMRVTPDIECETLRGIQASTGAAAIGVYNATDSVGGDLIESQSEREMIDQHLSILKGGGWIPIPPPPSTDKPVKTLVRIILGEVLSGRPPEIWAHSQGAAIASLALVEAKDLLAKKGKTLSGVRVTSFAGAAPRWPDGPVYEHYIHTRDAVPRYSGLGRLGWMDRFTAGANAKVVRFAGSAGKFTAPDGGMPSLTGNHDILAVYLPRWKRDHRDQGGR
jgi:hypothetical protein